MTEIRNNKSGMTGFTPVGLFFINDFVGLFL
jgi:hypothetical protein